MFQVRKDGFKDNPSVPEDLDLVEEEDQFTHMTTLDDATSGKYLRVTGSKLVCGLAAACLGSCPQCHSLY